MRYRSEMAVISEGSPGRFVSAEWNGRPVDAWVPAPLSERDLSLTASDARAAERAVATLRAADSQLPATWEVLARLLLRHEGIASSGIEGLREPVESVLVAERVGGGGPAGWVADNLAVIGAALDVADQPLTAQNLHTWHEQLMRHSNLPTETVGAFRPALGWVGGRSPLDAAYVSPPPQEIPRLVDDLVRFADRFDDDLDAVTQAALVHAQFEVIHPYGDGNGRLGRVLVSRTLRRAGAARRSTVPISVAIARDPGGYLSGLRLFEQGQIGPWVRWFAEIAERAARTTTDIVQQTEAVQQRWAVAVAGLRADSTALALLPLLVGYPVLCASDAAELLDVSERSGRSALDSLAQRGIVKPIHVETGRVGRSRHWFAASDLLEIWAS